MPFKPLSPWWWLAATLACCLVLYVANPNDHSTVRALLGLLISFLLYVELRGAVALGKNWMAAYLRTYALSTKGSAKRSKSEKELRAFGHRRSTINVLLANPLRGHRLRKSTKDWPSSRSVSPDRTSSHRRSFRTRRWIVVSFQPPIPK